MFYGTHFIMSPPAKSKLKRQGQLLSSVLSRTLSYKYRDLDATCSSLGTGDDPAELSTQLSAPGVLKVFGDSVCTGTHYKSVLATGTSSARELVKEALERYALSPERAGQYVLCDVVGQAGDSGRQWQAEGFRVFGDNEKPLLIQELWKPREGLSRRFELRKRSEMEELAARDVDTVTAGQPGLRAQPGAAHGGPEDPLQQAQHQPLGARHPASALHHPQAPAVGPGAGRGTAGPGAHPRGARLGQLLGGGGPRRGAAPRGPALPGPVLPAAAEGPSAGPAPARPGPGPPPGRAREL